MSRTDAVVVGSGPSAVQAASKLLACGASVAMLDFGNRSNGLEATIPEQSFSTLRATDPGQHRYFLGETFSEEEAVNDRLGSHFSAPRSYITENAASLLPVRSDTFFPIQSLALGGLGAGWGAGAQTFEDAELDMLGSSTEELSVFYDEVSRDVGISGDYNGDTASQVLRLADAQHATEIDTNAQAVLAAYNAKRVELNRLGFSLGKAPLALLTEALQQATPRGPNPYTDMDFYGTSNGSVYRPKHTVDELERNPRFQYISRALVERFEESEDGARVWFKSPEGSFGSVDCAKVVLAAGPLNSARIVLASLRLFGTKLPLLCNVMHYVPCITMSMLGARAAERRHSLAQLLAVYSPTHRVHERVIAAFYSYRSLLHFRLVKEMPLPTGLGLLVSRLLLNSLTLVGVHHPEHRSNSKWVRLAEDGVLEAEYASNANESLAIERDLNELKRCLRRIGCVPFGCFTTEPGSSIHYAGTIPRAMPGNDAPLQTDENGKLVGSKHVFLADSSTWNHLPAKGPTLTIMANARRVAQKVAEEVRRAF